jgi:large subunit ribosomal protein L28
VFETRHFTPKLSYQSKEKNNFMKCDICGKSEQFGHNVSHSKRRTNHRWVANIQQAKIVRDGKSVRLTLCTRCLRTQQKMSQSV